ncbi:TPA: tyrosine-type recombinase/integrase, partial [Streptococcus agalactiae]
KTTLGTYSHLRPNAMKEVANRMTGQVVVTENHVRKSKFNGNQHTVKFDNFSKILYTLDTEK